MHVAFIPASCCAGPDWVGGGGSCMWLHGVATSRINYVALNAASSLHLVS